MRKRSHRKPRELINPLTHVLSGLVPVRSNPNYMLRTSIAMHNAYEALRTGKASRDEFDGLRDNLNVTQALAQRIGHGIEYLTEINAAHDAMRSIKARGIKATGPELMAVLRAVEIHDAQLQIATVVEVEKAWAYVCSQVASQTARKV